MEESSHFDEGHSLEQFSNEVASQAHNTTTSSSQLDSRVREPMQVSDYSLGENNSEQATETETMRFSEYNTSESSIIFVPNRNDHQNEKDTKDDSGSSTSSSCREEQTTFPNDCYSFIALYGGFPFFYGLAVFFFQFAFLYLMIVIRWENANENNDNPHDGLVASVVPSNVSTIIRITQILALVAFIVFADHSLNAVVKAVELFPYQIRGDEDPDRIWRARLSCFLRFVQGSMACLTTLLLVMSSKDGIEIILNFAAVNFISNFDHQAFQLAQSGRYGPGLQEKARAIENTKGHSVQLPKSMRRREKNRMFWYWGTVGVVATVFLAFVVVIVTKQESNTTWTTQLFRVQFGDEQLEQYNGCYYAGDKSSNHHRRVTYERKNSRDFGKNTTIRYCDKINRWVFYSFSNGTSPDETDPCNAYKYTNDIAHSSETNDYGISEAFETPWFSPWDQPLDVYFIENHNNEGDDDNGAEDSFFCESFPGNGVCDVDLNNFEYKYDGGDCCASTCTKGDDLCGKGELRHAFGETVWADGFPNCEDPDMVDATIFLDFVVIRDIPNWAADAYQDESEWKMTWMPRMELFCDETTRVFSLPLRSSMKAQSLSARVEKGSKCTLFLDHFCADIQAYPSARQAEIDIFVRNTLPSDIGGLTELNRLNIPSAGLTGTIPTEIGLLDSSLKLLDLSGNTFGGSLPSEIGRLTSLTKLDLRNNALTGPIPTEIGLLRNLTVLDLGNNGFEERIPREVHSLKYLQLLYLDGNNLQSEVNCNFFSNMSNDTKANCERINYYSAARGTRMPTASPTDFIEFDPPNFNNDLPPMVTGAPPIERDEVVDGIITSFSAAATASTGLAVTGIGVAFMVLCFSL